MSTGSDSDGSNGRYYSSRSSKAKTYDCKICGNQFNSGQSLGGHMNVHRKDERSSRSSPSSHCSADSGSMYKGVRYRSEQNKWVAEIRPPKSSKTWWLGTYDSAIEAAYAYDVAITYFDSETSLNFQGHPVYDQIPRISPNLPKQDFAVQLRKVVKKYGKLAMESHQVEDEEGEVEEEEQGSSSSCDQYTDHQQQEDSVDDAFDLSTFLAWPISTTDVDEHSPFDGHSPFDDFEMPPVESYNYGGYDPEPASYATYNFNQMSPDHDPSGYYNGCSYLQQQLWSPYNYGGNY